MSKSGLRLLFSVLVAGLVLAACSGKVAHNPGASGGINGAGGSPGPGPGAGGSGQIDAGGVTAPPTPFEAVTASTSVRKVKNLLTGLAPTDEEVAAVAKSGAAGLQTLINTWMTDANVRPLLRDKMVVFFRNTFQQVGFSPTDDFKPQLLENGGFDFGPLGWTGDDAFPKLVQNLQDSFALTAWQLVEEGRPFREVLTTSRYMMTTALKVVYTQVEMPNDQPYAFGAKNKLAWSVDMSGTPIPLETSLMSGAGFLLLDDQPAVAPASKFTLTPTCQGTAGKINTYSGYAQLFQRLIGFTPRAPFAASPECWEHPSKPYLTANDLSDWQWVTVRQPKSGETPLQPYDLPGLRKATELLLKLPRVGFYTTPAFMALWNTNDSNQHRVTANQTLLVALGQSFSSEDTLIPLSAEGIDQAHSVNGSECYGCHKNLDPLRQFWANQFDFNDRNDFPTQTFGGGPKNPRPATTGGVLAIGSVNAQGATMADLGNLLGQVVDARVADQPVNRFALALAQKLCFFANSAACLETDPELRRVAKAFESSSFNFPTLLKEMMSSPLVTGAATTATFEAGGMNVSVSRRDQFCAALSNRLGKPDLCAKSVPQPNAAQTATQKIAGAIPADAFSRGAESPVTPSSPTLFYRAGAEMLCENVAPQAVDSVFSSTDTAGSIDKMVTTLMGYPPGDPHHAMAAQVLQAHFAEVMAQKGNTAQTALRSVFVLACESPTAVSFGL